MSQPYIGQLLLVPYSFAPAGWAFCDGSLISISNNDTLFNLIGTTYGGDGQNTFALPDLRGRVSLHQGTSPFGTQYTLGQVGGVENVTVSNGQMPVHTHPLGVAGVAGNTQHPSGALMGDGSAIYHSGAGAAAMSAAVLTPAGGSQPHTNVQPYQALNWIISLFGIYPSPS